MFFRIFKIPEDKEVLYNANHITKIEVRYAVDVPGNPNAILQDIRSGIKNPDAIRHYTVYVAGDVLNLRADPDNPVVSLIEQIYNDAVKKTSDESKG